MANSFLSSFSSSWSSSSFGLAASSPLPLPSPRTRRRPMLQLPASVRPSPVWSPPPLSLPLLSGALFLFLPFPVEYHRRRAARNRRCRLGRAVGGSCDAGRGRGRRGSGSGGVSCLPPSLLRVVADSLFPPPPFIADRRWK